jgi:ABC-2 type transport system ATP-binding protein
MQDAIKVEDLRVSYRAKNGKWSEAVKGLSFRVSPGEVVGFLGPNGAGKSSTLKALMGFVAPRAGKCEVFGQPAGSLAAKQKTGYLPEVAMYYPYLTPLETLRLYGELQGLGGRALKQECDRLVELVSISHAAKKLNRSLSKGMLQRVGIAQALLGNPELLVLDEVTSGLDPVGRKELRMLLRERQQQGCTLFFSSHELAEVDMLCDRILLIHKGELVEERLVSPLREELRQYSLIFRGEVALHDLTQRLQSNESGEVRAEFVDKQLMLKAMERIAKSGGVILDVVSQEGSLEQYFVDRIEAAA